MTSLAPEPQVTGPETFREAAEAYKRRVAERTGTSWPASSWRELDTLVDSVAGLDLDAHEWHLMRWFISWDALDTLASIITKAREQGPTS